MKSRLKYIFIILAGLSLSLHSYGQLTAGADLSIKTLTSDKLSSSTAFSDSLLRFAFSYLKTPYRMGATGTKAFDCSGFSGFVFRNFGYDLNRTAAGQASADGIEVPRTGLKPGDLVFFQGRSIKKKRVGHVGIVVEADNEGNFKFIHASIKLGVTITESGEGYYDKRYVTARRIISKEDRLPYEAMPIQVNVPELIIH